MDSIITTKEPEVTAALVKRVAERVGTGLPRSLALAGEAVSLEDYEKFLRENPELAGQEGAAERDFVQTAIGMLLDAKDASANVRWLLERLYPEVFGGGRERERKQDKVEMEVTTIAGISEEEVRQIQEAALRL